MKKLIVLALFLSLVTAPGFAAGEAKKSSPGFWEKEAERSGFSQLNNPTNFLHYLNPMPFFKTEEEQYKTRKAAQGK